MAVLYDQFGREIKVEKKPETREIAAIAIRDRWSTYPSQGLTPEKLATIFKEADAGDVYRQAELFEEMEEKDTHLFSQLQTRKNAVLGLEYEILAASESSEDKKIRDFTAEVISGLAGFSVVLLDLLDAIGKGFSMVEIMWDVEGKSVIPQALQWIHHKRANFYEFGKTDWEKYVEVPRILTEAEPIKGEEMPPFKLIYHRYKARSGYDTRAGLLRTCAWMYLFKNYSIKDWVAFAEVFGMPLRLGKFDSGATPEDKAALVAAIQNLGSDAAGIISKSTEIEFIETAKAATKENVFKALAEFCDKQMSKAILGQTASSEGTPGKLGNEKAQDQVRHDLLEADAKALGKTGSAQLIRPVVGYNFGWDKPCPQLKFQCEEPEDLKALSEVYKNLHEINQPISAEHVSERFKVPMPKRGETVLPGRSGPMAMKRIIAARQGRFSPEQEDLEGLVLESGKRAQGAVSGLLEPIKELVLKADSLDELRGVLLDIYAGLDDRDMELLLQEALGTAALHGVVASEKRRR